MKLFIFEGSKREPRLFTTLERLFFESKEDDQRIVCCYNSNIYSLYQHYMRYGEGADIISILREIMKVRDENPFTDDMLISDFAEIYLFFDYDFHDSRYTTAEINSHLEDMLNVFNDETENGKLYISYPMIEALRYTKILPDEDFNQYIVNRAESHDFKRIAAEFSGYTNGWDFITINEDTSIEKYPQIYHNWKLLIHQHVVKANWLCTEDEEVHSVSQLDIFNSQCKKYVIPHDSVSILSAFTMFLYDYFGSKIVAE